MMRRAAALLVAGAGVLALAALSRVPWSAEPSDEAVLRLAWRYASPLVDACRRLPEDERARLPVHMRRDTECERRLMPYRLEVIVDGAGAAGDSVAARGARADRPLNVFRELRLAPGGHRVGLRFTPYGEGAPAFTLDTMVVLAARQVVLATIAENRALVLRAGY